MKIRTAVAFVALFLAASTARAELVFFTTGRVMSVKAHRTDGDALVISLRDGGEVSFSASLVSRIEPDEAPFPEPVAQGPDVLAQRPAEQTASDRTQYDPIIDKVAAEQGVDAKLVRAMIQVESNYQERARSPKGAMGLMQLMPQTVREYNLRNPYDPKSNIEAGIKRLKSLIDKWGVELALAAYNAGEGAVARFNGVPPYRETRSYVSRILALAGLQ